MSLSTKSNTWRYLVCSRAKAGAGCRYRAVRYSDVERIICNHSAEIATDASSGNAESERLAGEIETLETSMWAHADRLEKLLANAAHQNSPALARRIAETEVEIAAERTALAELDAKRLALVPARWLARLDDFQRAAATDPLDRQAVNAALRVLLTGVVVNYRAGDLEFHWKHGGWSRIPYAWGDEDAIDVGTAAAPATSLKTPPPNLTVPPQAPTAASRGSTIGQRKAPPAA
jgi:hypothetical protein